MLFKINENNKYKYFGINYGYFINVILYIFNVKIY